MYRITVQASGSDKVLISRRDEDVPAEAGKVQNM